MSHNQISVTGIVANIPELKFAPSGTAYLALSVPDKRSRKNDQGVWEDLSATTWFRATVFGDVAEMLAEKVSKLDEVTVTGRLVTREFEKDGETRQALEVHNARVAWHGPKQQRPQPGGFGSQRADPWTQPRQGGYGDLGQQGAQWGGAGNDFDEPPF